MIGFQVHSRQSISNVIIKDTLYAVISITCEEDDYPNLNLHEMNPYCLDILKIKFDDIWDIEFVDSTVSSRQCKLFTKQDAEEILSFFYSIKNKIGILLVSCDAGISRSAAVAASLLKIFKDDDTEIYNNPRFHPNPMIYRIILDTYNEATIK